MKTNCHFIFRQLKVVKSFSEDSTPGSFQDKKTTIVEEADSILAPSNTEEPDNQSTKLPTEVECHRYLNSDAPDSETLGKRKATIQSDAALHDSALPPDDSQDSCKKLKRTSDDVATVISDYSKNLNLGGCDENKHVNTCAFSEKSIEHSSNKLIVSSSTCQGEHEKVVVDGSKAVTNETELKTSFNHMGGKIDAMLSLSDWKPLEKELYLKGVEMFGRNRYGPFSVLAHTIIMLRKATMAS